MLSGRTWCLRSIAAQTLQLLSDGPRELYVDDLELPFCGLRGVILVSDAHLFGLTAGLGFEIRQGRQLRQYAVLMSDLPLSSDEIHAAAEVHRELGPEYKDAVVESFLENIDKEIGARVEAQIDKTSRALKHRSASTRATGERSLLKGVVIGSIITGIAPTVAIMADYVTPVRLLAVIWVIVAAICAACAIRLLPPGGR